MSFRPFYDGPSYGTNSSSSSASENVPLRRRNEGGGFVSADSDMNAFGNYNDLPFTSLKRRRQQLQNGNSLVKWTMRAVLASPVIVLCLWTLAAFVFTSSNSSNNRVTTVNATARQMASVPATSSDNNSNNILIVPQPAASASQPAAAGGGGNMMMLSQTQVNPEHYMMASDTASAAAASGMNSNNNNNMVPEQPLLATQNGNTVRVVQPANLGAAVANAAPMATSTGGATTSNSVSSASASSIQAPPQQQSTPAMTKSNNRNNNVKVRPRPAPRKVQPPVVEQQQQQAVMQQVYYYDPAEATKSGSLQVPSVVYDTHGNAVPLQALQAAEIYLEPPKARLSTEDAVEVAATILTEAQPQAAASVEVTTPELTMQSPEAWGESSAQDQSIIISTVAVMALLVGALSARRMRARSFLSSCIENESLEDDAAYDTAYTAVDNSYNTFGGWKGDLEKFDV